MRSLAIIPARSGSKGVKDKNIRELCGKPLMAYSIAAALESGCFDKVVVSTDSEEYARIGREYGAEVPFLRSEENSRDQSSSWSAVLEVINAYRKQGEDFSHICLLQPTSPLRTSQDIREAFNELLSRKAKAVVSVSETDDSPMICNSLNDDQSMEGFIARKENKRRQEMNTYYKINGAIYLCETDFLEADTFLYRKGCYAYVMKKEHSVDIDTEFDFLFAETMMCYGESHIIERKKLKDIDNDK